MKVLIQIIFIVGFLLITFFGIGPVIFADGVMSERLITLAIVIMVYGIWIWIYRLLVKRIR